MDRIDQKAELPSRTLGTPKGEELVRRKGREPGREDRRFQRTARDSTSISAAARDPIDPRMPHMPPP
ncbi:MAG: hypothetical protein JWO38_1361 [Gemmataceae bacterium]|nr:hypothetical protein [Gemmataceae bacterium]